MKAKRIRITETPFNLPKSPKKKDLLVQLKEENSELKNEVYNLKEKTIEFEKEMSVLHRKIISLEVKYVSVCKKNEELVKRIHKSTLPMITEDEMKKSTKE